MDIAQKWSEVTLKKYDALMDYLQTCSNDDDISRSIEIYSLLSDNPDEAREYLLNVPVSELSKELAKIKFIEYPYQPDVPEMEYSFGDKKYVVQYDVKKMTAAQYIDFQNLQKDMKKNFKNLFMCFLIPKGKKYAEGYDVLALADELYDIIPISVVSDIMFFFVQLLKSWTISILLYSIKKVKRITKKEKNPEIRSKGEELIIQLNKLLDFTKNEDDCVELIKLVMQLNSLDLKSIN